MQKNKNRFLRAALVAVAALMAATASQANTVITYTTTITPDSSTAGYAGTPGMFYLPYSPANSNVTVSGTTPVSANVGSFITDSVSGSNNPTIVATNIDFAITPTISGITFGTLNFIAAVASPASNVYCMEFATTSAGPFKGSTNCTSSTNPGTYVSETFDNGLFQVELPSYLQINSPTKTTTLPVLFGAVPVVTPEPASMSLVGGILVAFAFALRRRAQSAAKA